MALLIPPQYNDTPNYCRNGMYMPYELQPSTASGMHTWVQNLEACIGTNLEVLSLGLPNDMGNPTSTLQKMSLCPQAVVWAMPGTVNGTSGGGSLQALNNGDYDSLIDATTQAFINVRGGGAATSSHGEDIVRPMWEFDFSNYNWGIGKSVNGHVQTQAEAPAGLDRIAYRMKVSPGGFTGRISLNGGYDPLSTYNVLSHPELFDNLDFDLYNSTGVANRFDFETIWTQEKLPRLTAAAAVARAKGMRIGFPECGCEVKNDSYHSRPPNVAYWTHLHDWCKANADVADYVTPFNQSIPSGAATKSADDALFYCAVAGTVPSSITSLGSLHSTSVSAAWTATTSPLKSVELTDYLNVMVAGTMQIASTPPAPPATTSSTAPQARLRRRGLVHEFG